MREYQIKIEPFEYVAIRQMEINHGINEHAAAKIAIQIKDGLEKKYMDLLSNETWVKITAIDGPSESENTTHQVLFRGLVVDYELSRDGYETILRIELKSASVLMDLKQHFRIFQNPDTFCKDICRRIAEVYSRGTVSYTEGDADKTGGVLIQYRETDWEFLKRLAGRSGMYLIPDALQKGVKFTVGLPDGITRAVETDRIQVSLDMGEYLEKSQNGMNHLNVSDMVELVITDRESFRLGDKASYQGREYFICRIRTEYLRGECRHTYYFRTKEALKVLPAVHKNITGGSFEAVVTGVWKDKVQVTVEKDEWNAFDGSMWFPYSTVYSSPDGTGWYCMPEIGDGVRLYIPDREENSFVLSAVHKETEGSRQNPDHKSFKNKQGKEILITPEAIRLTNNQGLTVELDDGKGITIASDKSISIQAAGNLTVASNSSSLLIAADERVQVRQGSTTMTLSDDISFTGGEFRIQ